MPITLFGAGSPRADLDDVMRYLAPLIDLVKTGEKLAISIRDSAPILTRYHTDDEAFAARAAIRDVAILSGSVSPTAFGILACSSGSRKAHQAYTCCARCAIS